jgi:hypothetical protein
MLVDTNSPKLARADINDMFADLGYSTIGSVSPITTTGEANKLIKFSAIANTILHFLRIRRSSTTALDVQNDSSTSVFNVDTTNEVITGTSITTTGEANKLFKFSAIANTILHFLRIRKSSTTALSVQDDSSVDVLNVDSINKIVTSYNQKITGLAGTGNRMVVADASGNLSSPKISIQRVDTANITSTSFVNIGVTVIASVVSEMLIGFYNTSTGSQGCAKFLRTTTGGLTQLALVDGTGCGVAFQMSGNELQAKVTSGSIACLVKVESLI